ncbi:hypothetical protein DNC80_10320 [Flavobacterium sp. SOK18b]|uniref:fibronectin type III domain-containing protein n=1 Tax=Flavobacterium sp. SOK18b TaxID=797900 RepID=UPI0015F7F1C3|nr:fibronectin type III domain-containing protein [Flavobacterium sp. SOK18b]MBB1194056.1 hypothetical protein [Flavobacterium sp. SOK18b]
MMLILNTFRNKMGKKNDIAGTDNKLWIENKYTTKMLKKQTYFFIFLLLLAGITGFAQTLPVTISTQMNQPSPIYWRHYADAATSNSPIKIQIVLNDLTIARRQVRLKCYWQGNGISFMNNDFVVGAQPLYLEGGVPELLNNTQLAPYFEFRNLIGLTPNQYAQPIPEGIYTFSVEVYDVATGQKLSRKSNVITTIFQNDPPLLNLPLNKASIMQENIQNIIFSWSPRTKNVSNVEYQFDLVEIFDKNTPIQNAFAYSKPIYTATIRTTTLLYGLDAPQLIPTKTYAWRIKAKAIVGAEEIGVFKNNGYSEIFSFSYDVYCTAPLQVTTDGVSQDQAKITWSGALDNFDYQVNYREKNADSQWYPLETPRENATLANLKPNTTYEYTVGASCEKGKYVHSSIQEFTTLAQDEIAFTGCGIKPDPKDLANQNPLENLLPNDVVTAGDFPIVVIKASGSNGRFTGEGYVTLPFLEKFRALIDAADALGGDKINIGQFSRIRITFDNIGVNTDFKLISGEIVASYDPEWKSIVDGDQAVNDIMGDNGTKEKPIDIPFSQNMNYVITSGTSTFDIAKKELTFKDDKGTIYVTSIGNQKLPLTFNDNSGKIYTIDKNGNVEPTGKVADMEARNMEMEELNSMVFFRNGVKYDSKSIMPVFLNNQEFEIDLVKGENTYHDIKKLEKNEEIIWDFKLGDKPLTNYKVIEGKIIFKIKAITEILGENIVLNVSENWGNKKEVGKLNIKTYTAPVVNFFRDNNYNSEFLFDDGFRLHQTLKDAKYYKQITTGTNKETHYTPVIALEKKKTATLNMELSDFKEIIKKDPEFALVFKPRLSGKIKINGQEEYVISSKEFIKNSQINILASEVINEENLTSMLIDVKVKGSDEIVGQIEYFCATAIQKTVKIIFTKCKDETAFYKPFTAQELQNYLNTFAFNQLFLNINVISEDFTINKNREELFKTTTTVADLLKEKYNNENPSLGEADDVLFITNQVIPDEKGYKGGIHRRGKTGGILFGNNSANWSAEEVKNRYFSNTAHELGHWRNMTHPFEEDLKLKFPKIINSGGETKDNIMDYNVPSKSWFKFQLEYMNR